MPQRQYNVNVNITNYNVEGNPVLIKYTINGNTKTVQINPKESIIMKIFEFSNQTITFSAEDIFSRAAVDLNAGKQRVEVIPLTEGQYEYIRIGESYKCSFYNYLLFSSQHIFAIDNILKYNRLKIFRHSQSHAKFLTH